MISAVALIDSVAFMVSVVSCAVPTVLLMHSAVVVSVVTVMVSSALAMHTAVAVLAIADRAARAILRSMAAVHSSVFEAWPLAAGFFFVVAVILFAGAATFAAFITFIVIANEARAAEHGEEIVPLPDLEAPREAESSNAPTARLVFEVAFWFFAVALVFAAPL